MQVGIALAFAAAALVASPGPGSTTAPGTASAQTIAVAEADPETSITYHGDVMWSVTVGADYPWPDVTVVLTCADDTCTADWEKVVFGDLPAPFPASSPRLVQSTPSSGSLCDDTYRMAVNIDLTASADRLTGTIERVGFEQQCGDDGTVRTGTLTSTIDFPRTAGNPCVLDESRPECAPATKSPAPTAGQTATPVDEPEGAEKDSDEGSPVLPVIAVAAAAAAAAAAATAAVSAARKRGATARGSASGPSDSGSELAGKSGVFENAMANAATNEGGSAPADPRQQMLDNLQRSIDATAAQAGQVADPPGRTPSDLSESSHLFENAMADPANSGGSGSVDQRQQMLDNLQREVDATGAEAGQAADPPSSPE